MSTMSSTYATLHPDANPRPRKRKFNREQLMRSLEIIGSIPAPLPPDLPPSPPASRSPSPAPPPVASSSKRKLESASDADSAKRIRKDKQTSALGGAPTSASSASATASSSTSTSASASASPPALPASSSSSSLHHVNTVHEAGAPSAVDSTRAAAQTEYPRSSALPTHFEPVKRPKGDKKTLQEFDDLHAKYYQLARDFKYSGDARFRSTWPPGHKHFKALANPPPLGSVYHTQGGLMSRLELLEALICFVYALWCQDYSRKRHTDSTWYTINSYLGWCKEKWGEQLDTVRQGAFLGLIHMIEAFIHQRKVQFSVAQHLDRELLMQVKSLEAQQKELAMQAANANRPTPGTQRTPPGMLPSPATLSANSTPTNAGNGTPTNANIGNASDSAAGPSGSRHASAQAPNPSAGLPAPDLALAALQQHPNAHARREILVPQALILDVKTVVDAQSVAARSMTTSQRFLSLPTLRAHFPRTFGRMVYSSLKSEDEAEPDIEDDDGELFWPGQCVTGEGLGWVCLMGRAMVREFGRDCGYRGAEAIIPKPDDMERRAAAGAARV